MTRTRLPIAAVIALLLLAALHITAIHSIHMRPDEEIAYRSTTGQTLAYTVWFQAEQDIHVPLWFASFWGWQHVAGDSEFMGRLYAVLLSLLTLALTCRIGREWFGHPRYGLFAMVLLGVNNYFFIYAHEIRPYALVMLLATASMWALRRWLVRCRWRDALLYGLLVAAMLYTHYFLAFLIAVQALYVALSRPPLRVWRQGAAAAGLVFALWLPWLPVFVGQVQTLQAIEVEFGNARGLGFSTATETTTAEAVLSLAAITTNGQVVLFGVLLLAGVWLLGRESAYRLALAWAVGVPALALAANLLLAVYTQRYITYTAVGVAVAAGAALAALVALVARSFSGHLPAAMGDRPPRRHHQITATMTIMPLLLITTLLLANLRLPQRAPVRDVLQRIDVQPGDVALIMERPDAFMGWQYAHYLPQTLTVVHQPADVGDSRRVWFITGEWFEADTQAAFAALEAGRPLQDVVGRCDRSWCYLAQLLEGPPRESPVIFGEALAFYGADIDAQTETHIDVRLWWRAAKRIPINYSFGLHLQAADGYVVAQSDGPATHYGETVQTSQFAPDGSLYIDTRHLSLPPHLPAGDYTLRLLVYDSATGERLPVAGDEGVTLLTLHLP